MKTYGKSLLDQTNNDQEGNKSNGNINAKY